MQVFLVRHAKAAPGEPDALRPLTPHGRQQARELGRRLAGEGVRPSAVLTSPLLRARETADEIARATGSSVEPDERLAPGATVDDLRDAAAGRDGPLVVVGHQPDCGLIAGELTGEEQRFPTAGLCVVEL